MSNIIASATGTITEIEKGERGAIERPRSWDAIADGSSIQSGTDGEKYIDIVLYGTEWYQCIKSFTKGDGILPTNTIYFTKITDYQRLATNLFLAKTAYIENLGVMNIKITDDGTENGNVLLQADKDGIVCNSGTFTDVTVSGSLCSPFKAVGKNMENKFTDNLSLVTDNGVLNVTMNKVDVKQVGRLIHVTNYRWNNSYQNGYSVLKMPDGYYFFEDGVQKSSIKVSRECVTLLGLGDSSSFYGWLVLDRVDIMTSKKYGHCKKVLALGQVKGTPNGASFAQYTTFDGSQLSVVRNNTGVYTITFPSSWNLSMPHIMLTGVGRVYKDDGNLSDGFSAKATLISTTATSMTVWVSDDESRNDGSFNFEISNFEDFSWLNN